MSLEFPDFSKHPLLGYADLFCIVQEECIWKTVSEERIGVTAEYNDGSGVRFSLERSPAPEHKARKESEPFGFDVHCSVRLARKRDSTIECTSDLASLEAAVEPLLGASGFAFMQFGYRIPLGQLPESGIIRAFQSVNTMAGGRQLSLNGAKMQIKEDQFREVAWTLGDDDMVSVDLSAIVNITIEDSFLMTSIDRMNQGLNEIVLEGGADEGE